MLPAGAIGKLGFRRWYERELLLAHAWLVACILAAFGALAEIEQLSLRGMGAEALLPLAVAFAAGIAAWYSLSRYLHMLLRAQALAQRSTCPECGTYGRYSLVGAMPSAMIVCCRECGHEWRIG
jgi:hypothetical protein